MLLTKEGNCFTQVGNQSAFAAMAEALLSEGATGLLTAVCDRWIYKACLNFALDPDERKRSRFRYEYSLYQLEYNRNLLFRHGSAMAKVVEAFTPERCDVNRYDFMRTAMMSGTTQAFEVAIKVEPGDIDELG